MRFVLALISVLAASIPAYAQPLVVLDAGHGGTDPGAVGCSIEEADVVLDVTQRLQVLLEGAGVRVALTRDSDTFVGLSARAAFANARGAAGFVSIHSNANSGTPGTGTETFVYPGSGARTRALGTGVQAAMIAAWGLRDRGLKEGNYAVLRETTMPAALGELAFTNNCGTDAALLRDPSARQRAAEHLRDAILAWLGVSPVPTTGTLRGVVYEDQGVGAEDLTVRLPGAAVRVIETGARVAAGGTDAAWSFALAPGEYTVEARLEGREAVSRRCQVTSGATTWCSIGLARDAMGPEVDAGSAEPERDAAVEIEVDASAPRDAGARSDAGRVRRGAAEGGCAVAHGAEGSRAWVWVLALACGIVALRRGRVALLALAMLGCAEAPPRAEPAVAVEPLRIGATPVESLATLSAPREWLAPDRHTPILSPDGAHVLLATRDHRALFVLDLAPSAGSMRELCRVGQCGWEPAWQSDGEIAFRVEGQSGTAVPAVAVTLEGAPRPVTIGERGVHAWVDGDDRAWLRIEGRTRAVGPEGERVMTPELTADRRHVVLWGMTEGVLVHRVSDGAIVHAGPGSHPRVDPSGRWLVFERTEDDGHVITASDLFVVDLGDPRYPIAPLLATPDRVERMPSLSRVDASGAAMLAYLDGAELGEEGVLVVRPVRFAPR